MIYKKEFDQYLILTSVSPDSPVVTIRGDFVKIWNALDLKISTETSKEVPEEILDFLIWLEKLGLLPHDLSSAEAASYIPAEFKIKALLGSFQIEEVEDPLQILASCLPDPYNPGEDTYISEMSPPPCAKS